MLEITVSENGVYKFLLNMSPKRAAGPDGVPCPFLKAVAKELAPPMTLLFNSSLAKGQVTQQWETRDGPKHLQGGRQEPGSYLLTHFPDMHML